MTCLPPEPFYWWRITNKYKSKTTAGKRQGKVCTWFFLTPKSAAGGGSLQGLSYAQLGKQHHLWERWGTKASAAERPTREEDGWSPSRICWFLLTKGMYFNPNRRHRSPRDAEQDSRPRGRTQPGPHFWTALRAAATKISAPAFHLASFTSVPSLKKRKGRAIGDSTGYSYIG